MLLVICCKALIGMTLAELLADASDAETAGPGRFGKSQAWSVRGAGTGKCRLLQVIASNVCAQFRQAAWHATRLKQIRLKA